MELAKNNSTATAASMFYSKCQSPSKSSRDGRRSVDLLYANKPLSKDIPRWNQSATTWRHTSHRYSFSKDDRFHTRKYYHSGIIEPELPSTRSSITCTFGKDEKKPISLTVLRNAKEKPSPDHYDLKEFTEEPRSPKKGKTFGLGWNKYERVYIQHRQDVYSGHFN